MTIKLYAFLFPAAAGLLAAVSFFAHIEGSDLLAATSTVLLLGTAFSAVQHAELISARVGQPYGTLVLTFSVTLIEVSVLVSLMLHGENNPTLAREAVLSTVMFVLTGVVGICLLMGALRHREQVIQQQGVSGYLSVILAISVLALILPDQTWSGLQGLTTQVDVVFIMIGVVLLYGSFLFMQTVRHRSDFMGWDEEVHARPRRRETVVSRLFLLLSLVGVVTLSSHVAGGTERLLSHLDLVDPSAVVGAVVVAMLLLPETITAVKAARRNQLQRALNTALGSALATIGLTMPVMVAIGFLIDKQVELRLDPEDRVQLLLALVLSVVSFGTGRTNALTGLVHMVLFMVYVLTLFSP
ncbi:calcium:proton antiporter [Aquabacter cavernae]|uniref:calcium:proton antiporter n=1 Tax=Aquabacter cavernae TaxID=2496029 RepID=UPI000F8F0E6B|nr:ionic transporter [Aquabacter cavernae]